MLHEPTTEDRPERGAAGESRCPHGHGEPAAVRVREDVADQGQRGRHEHGSEDAHAGASGNEPLSRRRERGGRGNRGEACAADQQQAAAADPVSQVSHGHQKRCEHQRIGIHDPQQLHAPTSSDRAISGRANVSAVLSTATSSTGNIRSAKAAQSRHGADWIEEVRGCWVVDGVNMKITVPSGRYSFNLTQRPAASN